MATGEFDLRALVRNVADTSDSADPGALADEVLTRIEPHDRVGALEQSLRVFVQHVISLTRYRVSPSAQSDPGNQPVRGAGENPPTGSWKVAGVREGWRQQLRDRIFVGTTHMWKFLGDCTRDDCGVAAAIRDSHARTNAARAQLFRRLADLITQHQVTKVSELPDDVLAAVLGDSVELGDPS